VSGFEQHVPGYNPDMLETVESLIEDGRALEAYQHGTAQLPIRQWPDSRGKIAAGRLAGRLGAPRLARALFHRAHKLEPRNPRACIYKATVIWESRGQLRAWEFLKGLDLGKLAPEDAADLGAVKATVLLEFRDFERAHELIDNGLELQPDSAWLHIIKGRVHLKADEYAQAEAHARRALDLKPRSAHGFSLLAHLLTLRNQRDEALALLRAGLDSCRDLGLALEFGRMLRNESQYAEARDVLRIARELAPLAEPQLEKLLLAQSAHLHLLEGNAQQALEEARLVATGFHRKLHQLSTIPPTADRRLIPVPFVRQHFETCAPATLTALCQWYGREADHLEIANRICYGGTSSHAQRAWAEANEFVVREFRMTADNAKALVDRNLPFAVATQEAASGHMQAVVGYDDRRGVLLVRDPYLPDITEYESEEFFRRYRSTGPRAMLMLPKARSAEAADLVLEDELLYACLYRLESSLERHDHHQACMEARRMSSMAPDHELGMLARFSICAYEGDHLAALVIATRLHELYPDSVRFAGMRLSALGALNRSDERAQLLAEVQSTNPHPMFDLMAVAARQSKPDRDRSVRRTIRRVLPAVGHDHRGLMQYASVLYNNGQREAALDTIRLAVTGNETEESVSQMFFGMWSAAGRGEEALSILRKRHRRYRHITSEPSLSLTVALRASGLRDESNQVLQEALQARPDDPGLHRHLVTRALEEDDTATARSALAKAPRQGVGGGLHDLQVKLLLLEAEPEKALEVAAQWTAHEPLRAEAWHTRLRIMHACHGYQAREALVQQMVEEQGHHQPLLELALQALDEPTPAVALPILERMLEVNPSSRRLRRLRATIRCPSLESVEWEQALAEIEQTPDGDKDVAILRCRALMSRSADPSEVHAILSQLPMDFDQDEMPSILIYAAGSPAYRADVLDRISETLMQHGIQPAGIQTLSFLLQAQEDELELESRLTALRDRYPESTVVCEAIAQHFVRRTRTRTVPVEVAAQAQMGLRFLDQALAQHPTHAALWLVRGRLLEAARDSEGHIQALRRSLQLQPESEEALTALAIRLLSDDHKEEGIGLLRRCVAQDPFEPAAHWNLMLAFRRSKAPEGLILAGTRALRLCSRGQQTWSSFLSAAVELCGKEEAVRIVETESRRWIGDVGVLSAISRSCWEHELHDLGLTVAQRAAEADPTNSHAAVIHAFCLRHVRSPQAALQQLDAALPQVSDPQQLFRMRADILRDMGDTQGAEQALNQCLTLNPSDQQARLKLAELLLDSDRSAAALEQIAKIGAEPQDKGRALTLAISAHINLKQLDEARGLIRQSLNDQEIMAEWSSWMLYLCARHGFVDELKPLLKLQLAEETRRPDLENFSAGCLAAWERRAPEFTTHLQLLCRDSAVDPDLFYKFLLVAKATELNAVAAEELSNALIHQQLVEELLLSGVWWLCQQRGWNDAAKVIAGIPTSSPYAAKAWHGLIHCAAANEAWDVIAQFAERAKASQSLSPDSLPLLAKALQALSKHHQALQVIQASSPKTDLNSFEPEVLFAAVRYLVTESLLSTRNWNAHLPEAEVLLRHLVKVTGSSAIAVRHALVVFLMGQTREAQAALPAESVPESDPETLRLEALVRTGIQAFHGLDPKAGFQSCVLLFRRQAEEIKQSQDTDASEEERSLRLLWRWRVSTLRSRLRGLLFVYFGR